MQQSHTTFGAFLTQDGARFSVWAPEANQLELVLYDIDEVEVTRVVLQKDERGIFLGEVKGAKAGTNYKYLVDGKGPFPDPASRYQPKGVHGASQVIDHTRFKWTDQGYKGIPSIEQVSVYELHVGTFTTEGTFKAAQSKLHYLKNELGVTAIEILPIADFPGRWNWGYDGVALYAPCRCYGTPDDLKELVNSAHALGLAVFIDLVYNHLGPDGNYLSCYNKHYFTEKFHTPWGAALNYDRSTSTGAIEGSVSTAEAKADASHAPLVRKFVLDNIITWIRDYHFDGARLDATHAIVDYSTPHLLQELMVEGHKAAKDRHVHFFAEDDRNEAELITQDNGLSCLWADDFHHQVRVCVAGDNESYFSNFTGTMKDLATTIHKGWFFCGQPVPDTGKPRGSETQNIKSLAHFCYCIQNHDQIGNRAMGERLNHSISPSLYKVASALLLLSPATPMLFQGQEWAATSPFQYFTDHNTELGKLVTEGRRKEFGKFKAFNDPATREKIPDPQAEATFNNSKLVWDELHTKGHEEIFKLYSDLLSLRNNEPALINCARDSLEVFPVDDQTLVLVRRKDNYSTIFAVFNMKDTAHEVSISEFRGNVVETILTTDDALYTTDTATPAVLKENKVQFHRAGAIVLRIK